MARLARLLDVVHRLRRRVRPRRSSPQGLLIVSAGGLGDTILFSLVAERFAALAQPNEDVTVLLRQDGAKTAFCLPQGLKIETVDFRRFDKSAAYRWQTLEKLHDANYRLVITTDFLRHPHLDEAMIVAAAAEESVAMRARPWPKYDRDLETNSRIYSRLFDSGEIHRDKVVRWSDFANWLNGEKRAPPKIALLDRWFLGDARSADAGGSPEIIIQPFSAVAAKQVDVACYDKLADAVPADFVLTVAGLESDLEKNPEYRNLISKHNVRFDSSTFMEISPRLASAVLVISVDTAMMHLATALGAPTLCLASAAYVGEIVPYHPDTQPENVEFLLQEMPCQGCLGHCVHPLANGRFACVDALTPDTVVSAVMSRL